MKKIIACFLMITTIAITFTGCFGYNGNNSDNKKSIVCTIFPEYDWVKEITGKHFADFNVSILLDSGMDMHSYQPTAEDILKISNCDMFIYVGGESDEWVEDVLKSAPNNNRIDISLMDVLDNCLIPEETPEGLEAPEPTEKPEYDEHVWLSLRNAKTVCVYLAEKLSTLDPDNKADYSTNVKNYTTKLESLDMQYLKAARTSNRRVLLFADRFPFLYITKEYGISYFAAFRGCSAETEASFETILFLANKINEFRLNSIIVLDDSSFDIAETIKGAAKNQDINILVLNSIQSVTAADIEQGTSYIGIMESNLNVIKTALG